MQNWQTNLRDAMLLDPLILIHGNVKDQFALDATKRQKVPRAQQKHPYQWFDAWLALEFEEQGFPLVLLYDPIDHAIALRGEMVPELRELLRNDAPGAPTSETTRAPASSSAEASAGATAAPRRSAPPALPSANRDTAVDPDAWMVPLGEQIEPRDFFNMLYRGVFPRLNQSLAVICRFTDRYLSYSDRQSDPEKRLSLLIQKAAMAIPAALDRSGACGRLALLFDLEGSIPQELGVQAPFARSVRIPGPSVEDYEEFFRANHDRFYSAPGARFDPREESGLLRDIANRAEGLKTQDLFSLITLSHERRKGLNKNDFKTLFDLFRFGDRENAWQKVSPETLRNAAERLKADVKGQDEVIAAVVPTLVRAHLGMTHIGAKYANKPRGVFFFVGPTGVGKTELCKSIARLIFGDDSALVRFDMSEFSEEHQQARLIGAPPGYVGFNQGGQLTNAILEKPFSVLLFDEIEKAHGRILDKFLQVIDDGRLTDGMGRTVYFSEAILAFTSNIGTAPSPAALAALEEGGVALQSSRGDLVSTEDIHDALARKSYPELCTYFRAAVKDFFVNRLGRPEILNRIGEENILVFNLLKDEHAKNQIIEKEIRELERYLQERFGVTLDVKPSFEEVLKKHPGGFERNGARGVRNLLSKLVMDKLAMLMFETDSYRGRTCIVTKQGDGCAVEWAKQ